jgi:hypothetical protein
VPPVRLDWGTVVPPWTGARPQEIRRSDRFPSFACANSRREPRYSLALSDPENSPKDRAGPSHNRSDVLAACVLDAAK